MRNEMLVACCLITASPAQAGERQEASSPPAARVASHAPGPAEAMARLSFLRGTWAGPAIGTARDGSHYSVTQTERVGPLLGGDVLLIEGRGYRDDGSTAFNALAIVSWNPRTGKYELRSYAQGQAGTFELERKPDGFVWEIPAGPGSVMRFTATVGHGQWHEVGEYVAPGRPPAKTLEMNLRRVGDTDWPLGAPVPPSAGR